MISRLSCAKRIFFENYGNSFTMKRNGEYEKYLRFKIPKEIELEWSRQIQNDIVSEIMQGKNLWKITALSQINLPKSELLSAFYQLALCSQKEAITEMLFKQEPLIEKEIYENIKALFRT